MRRLAPTEALHARAARLDPGDTRALLSLMAEEDARALGAVAKVVPALARLARAAARSIAQGGRLVYLGAGTSGRLGALDAAECPPTFGAAPGTVVGLIAGGERALKGAVEGAEDDAKAGARAVDALRLSAKDLAVGISASGQAPWVLAALARARARQATTALLTCNPRAARAARVDHKVVLRTGPEVVAGSTRLKAAAATRSALAMISTGAFARLGRVQAGRMVALQATNAKLVDRAARNVAALAGLDKAGARRALARAGGDVEAAVALARSARSAGRGALKAPRSGF